LQITLSTFSVKRVQVTKNHNLPNRFLWARWEWILQYKLAFEVHIRIRYQLNTVTYIVKYISYGPIRVIYVFRCTL